MTVILTKILKKMKKNHFIFALLILFTAIVASCSHRDDDHQLVAIDKIKIDSVKILIDTMDVYSVQSIRTYSTYPSQCYGFDGYDYVHDGMNRVVTAYAWKNSGPCSQTTYTSFNQFNFKPVQTGTYTFKFWNGGTNYITKQIVVE